MNVLFDNPYSELSFCIKNFMAKMFFVVLEEVFFYHSSLTAKSMKSCMSMFG